MTPEQRAEQIVTTEPGMDAIRHCDTFELERLIAAAICAAVLEEREACAKMFEGVDGVTEYVDFLGKDIAAAIRARNNP